jgi:hypothetical protein
MRKLLRRLSLLVIVFISIKAKSQNLIQATLKIGDAPNKVDVWLRPNFTNNNAHYLFQIGLPIAWPANAPLSPTGFTAVLDPGFVTKFGNNNPSNYTVTPNQIATSTNGLEKYSTIFLVRQTSNFQSWTSGVEFKVLSITFNSPPGSPGTPVKIADYQNGGSDGQGNFYTQDESNNYYVVSNSKANFYASGTESFVGGTADSGYVQTTASIPVSCVIPSLLTANSITNNSATMSWNSVPGATGYEYVVSTSSITPTSGTAITTNSYNAGSLAPSTQYYVFVRTNCGGGSFSNWANTNFNTATVACTNPGVPTINNIGITTADIAWTTVSGAAGYEYVLSTSSTLPAIAPGTGTATTSTTYSPSGLTGGTHYYIFLRTNCGSGNYSPWVSADFTTQPPLCSPPSTSIISSITTTTASINWNAVSGSSGYEYVLSTNSGIPAGAGTSVAGTSINPTGLTSGTTYYVFVRNNCGGGLFSDWAPANFNTLCPTPGSVNVNGITSSSASVSWNPNGAVSYQYDISTSLTPPSAGTTTTGTSYTATGLDPGTSYYAHVRAMCAAGNFSSWVDVPFVTICPIPGPMTIGSITLTGATISWGAVSAAEGYEYIVTTSSTPTGSVNATAYNNVSLSTLTQGTQYNVFVRTKCSPGVYSEWNSGAFATTCPSPSGLQVSNSNDKVNFSWSPVSGAAGYEYIVSTSATFPTTAGAFTSSTSVSVGGLTSSTQYYVYVRTQCGPNRYSQWARETITTGCYKPVIYLVKNLPTLGSAELGWHSIKGAIKYEYAIKNNAAPPAGSINFTPDTIIHPSGLVAGNKYYLHVRTHCSFTSISDWSTRDFYASGLFIQSNLINNVFTIASYGTEIQDGEIALFDGTGKLLKRIRLNGSTISIDLNSFAAGIYYIKYGKTKQTVKKIIKL